MGSLTPFQMPVDSSLEFRLRLESLRAKPSRPASAGQHLSWASTPYSTSGTEGPLFASSPARSVPPSGFGYPPDGLRPSIPCRFCFTPAALMGFTLRSFLLAKGTRAITTRMAPPAVSPAGIPVARSDGPAPRAAASGIQPFRESLALQQSFNLPLAGCSLGFFTPARSQAFKWRTHRDMGSPRTASCITADRPMLFGEPRHPTAVAGTGLRCRAFATLPLT
jgi:hypothetical protein